MGKYGPSGGGGGVPNSGFSMAVAEEIREVVVHIGQRAGAIPQVIVAIDFVSRQGQTHRLGGIKPLMNTFLSSCIPGTSYVK